MHLPLRLRHLKNLFPKYAYLSGQRGIASLMMLQTRFHTSIEQCPKLIRIRFSATNYKRSSHFSNERLPFEKTMVTNPAILLGYEIIQQPLVMIYPEPVAHRKWHMVSLFYDRHFVGMPQANHHTFYNQAVLKPGRQGKAKTSFLHHLAAIARIQPLNFFRKMHRSFQNCFRPWRP